MGDTRLLLQSGARCDVLTLTLCCVSWLVFYQDDLRKEDFSTMSAQLLYKMIKSKTEYPLHKAIKVEREDVVFLYLIEMDSQVSLPPPMPFIDRSPTRVFCCSVTSMAGYRFPHRTIHSFYVAFGVVLSYLASWMNWTTMATWHSTWRSLVNWRVLPQPWWTTKQMWTWWTRVAGASCTRPSKEVSLLLPHLCWHRCVFLVEVVSKTNIWLGFQGGHLEVFVHKH